MLCSSVARAGVWGADPSLGISGDYASNPLLVDLPHPEESNAALLLDSPVSYQGDALTLSFLPSFRLSDTRSYSSVNSDYIHLTASGQFDADLNSFKASVGATRDSSLYENYLVDGEAAVRRDGLNADLGWTRHLTERLDADIDVQALKVVYGIPVGNASLDSYKDGNVTTDLTWHGTERDKIALSVSGGQYDSTDGMNRSRSLTGQLAYTHALSEVWSLDLTAGYTRQQNKLNLLIPELVFTGTGFEIIEIPVSIESTIDSPVYSAKLTRTGPRLTVSLSASRQETPTGFAFLSQQTIYDLGLSYALSERWSLSLHEYWLSAHDPSLQGPYLDRTVNSANLDCTYQLTENYLLDLALSRIDETYTASDFHVANNQVTLTLTYKFNHIGLP